MAPSETFKGDRIRLVSTTAETAPVIGTTGTVVAVDNWQNVHVTWDDGSALQLVPGEDSWELIDEEAV